MVRIPDEKRYFRIGEASRVVGVEPYVLRYWEGEFPQIRPQRADSNQRTYRRRELELLLEVKHLLYEEGMTIEGARKRLKRRTGEKKRTFDPLLEHIKSELNQILGVLR